MSRQQESSTHRNLGLSNADFFCHFVISSHFSGGHVNKKEPLKMLCESGQVLPFLKNNFYVPLIGSMNSRLVFVF